MKDALRRLISGSLFASVVGAAEPEDISMDIAAALEGSSVPSLAAAVVVDGKIISAGAAGLRKVGEDEEVTVSDKYHLGSCTKSMTATLAAMLVEEGKVSWETTVADIFKRSKIHEGYEKVTLRQLLTNTGGTPKDINPDLWGELWSARGRPSRQRLELVEGILSEPPNYEPGSKSVYSNAGFAIAGAMLEEATGEAWEEMMRKRLFSPLGMKSAGFGAPATPRRVDQPYGHVEKKGEITPTETGPRGDNPVAIAPAGAVHASIVDFARYAQFHLGAIGKDLLSSKSLNVLHMAPEGSDYAMGWVVAERGWAGGKALTHTGSNTMFYAVIWMAPENNFAVVAASNLGSDEGFAACDRIIGQLIEKHVK